MSKITFEQYQEAKKLIEEFEKGNIDDIKEFMGEFNIINFNFDGSIEENGMAVHDFEIRTTDKLLLHKLAESFKQRSKS